MKHKYGVITPVTVQLPAFGISAFLSRHAGQFRMNEMSNEFHKLALVISGRGALQVDGETVALAAGAVTRIFPGVRHRFVDDPRQPLTLAVLCMTGTATALLPVQVWSELECALPSGTARWLPSNALLDVSHILRQITLKGLVIRPYSSILIAGMTAQVLAIVLDDLQQSPPALISQTVASTILWIDRHFAEPIRIDELAREAGLSYRAYTQQFRRATSCTVVDYVTRIRVQFAAQCLQSTGDILDSALEAGFGDLSHFYRVFRRHMGSTPREFLLRGLDSRKPD